MKTVGVVVATYNGEKYIREQLKSIINQNLKPNYIVVSDGNSTDNTVDICEKTLKESSIAFSILKSSVKLSAVENFEKGLTACNEEVIFFSDQDDVWHKDKISKMMDVFNESDVCMVFSNARIVDSDLNYTGKTLWDYIGFRGVVGKRIYSPYSMEYTQTLLKQNVVTGMCLAIDSSIKQFVVPFSKFHLHDSWIAFLSNQMASVCALNDCLVDYRQHSSNSVGASSNIYKSFSHRKNYLDILNSRKKFVADVLSKDRLNNSDYQLDLKEYIRFIDFRISYIQKKQHIFSVIKKINRYKLYEPSFIVRILKDVYIRTFCHV